MGAMAGLAAFGLAYATRPPQRARSTTRAATTLQTPGVVFDFSAATGELHVRSRDGAYDEDIALAFVAGGTVQPVALSRDDIRAVGGGLRAAVTLRAGEGTLEGTLDMHADPASDALVIELRTPITRDEAEDAGDGGAEDSGARGLEVALRGELQAEGHVVFVPGVGQIADGASVSGGALVIDADPHPFALLSSTGPVGVEALLADPTAQGGEPNRLTVTSVARPDGSGQRQQAADLRVVLGRSSAALWRAMAAEAGVSTAQVRGHVTGTGEQAVVFGRDAHGALQVRAHTVEGGAFDLEAPTSVVEWYAAVDPGRASALASFVPGTPRDLLLDISPGGDLHVTIVDADDGKPLTARLLVHGIDGTVDPSFGPDYRASGAGPIIDALRGDVTTPLPSGRYRVSATKGIEWSIDAKVVDIASGRVADVALAPRHVVPTPGVLACDLHVHARPSFDTPVAMEDRVLSLVSAGIDFAVPTEHNLVGDYSTALETLDLKGDLLSVTGVEVTTYSKGFGHFGVFPYPPWKAVPPFKKTNMRSIFAAVRAGDPNRYFQLNHPRLPKGIGYFNNIGFDPKGPRSHLHNRIDFDGIEVFNGYDTERPDRVEQVLRDYWALLDFGWRYTATGSSDSHRIQFHWAGYPRSMVTVDPGATLQSEKPVDPLTVVAQIKKGHIVVTTGPIVELELAGVHPGDEVQTTDDTLRGHLRVRAAPWVDISHVEIVVGDQVGNPDRGSAPLATVVQTIDVPSRPTEIGPEPGTLEEAQDRTIRLDRDLLVPMGPTNAWVQVIVRGDRRMDDVLPFMPVPPLAFTNPVYVVRHPEPPPPLPALTPATAPIVARPAP
jgi:hypothetical protein